MIIRKGMAYSHDFRSKVLSVRQKEGLTIAEVATRFGVGKASVMRWIKNIERKLQGPRQRKINMEALAKDVEQYPDAYQFERAKRFKVTQTAIFMALRRLSISFKKNAMSPKSRRRKETSLPRKN